MKRLLFIAVASAAFASAAVQPTYSRSANPVASRHVEDLPPSDDDLDDVRYQRAQLVSALAWMRVHASLLWASDDARLKALGGLYMAHVVSLERIANRFPLTKAQAVGYAKALEGALKLVEGDMALARDCVQLKPGVELPSDFLKRFSKTPNEASGATKRKK